MLWIIDPLLQSWVYHLWTEIRLVPLTHCIGYFSIAVIQQPRQLIWTYSLRGLESMMAQGRKSVRIRKLRAHILNSKQEPRAQTRTGESSNSQSPPQWHMSSSWDIIPKPMQTMTPMGDLVFKHHTHWQLHPGSDISFFHHRSSNRVRELALELPRVSSLPFSPWTSFAPQTLRQNVLSSALKGHRFLPESCMQKFTLTETLFCG